MSDEEPSEGDKSDGYHSHKSVSASRSSPTPESAADTSGLGVYRGGGDHNNDKPEDAPVVEEKVRLAWKSVRCTRASALQQAGDDSITDGDTVLRDVSGHATASSIVLIAGVTPLPPLTLLRVLAGEVNPDSGQVMRGGMAGLENMTISMDSARGNDRRHMLFEHLTVDDAVGSYVNRALPNDADRTPYTKFVRETIGSVLYPVSTYRSTIGSELPEHIANFITLNMVLRCGRKLILLDEPFVGLRFAQVVYIIGVLRKLRQQGCTIIISSSVHATLLLNNADQIYLFDRDGSLILQGRPSNPEVFKQTVPRTHTFAQTVNRVARFRRESTAQRKRAEDRLPQQLEPLPRITRGVQEGAAIFSEIMMNEITSNAWLISIPVVCSGIFAAMCVALARGRDRLSDKLQPYFDMNIYFFLQLFVALQAFNLGFRSTRCFLNVANREWRNSTYTLVDGLWASSSICTTVSTLCTCAVCMFVFLVTEQQLVRGDSATSVHVVSNWAPFLFLLAGLITSYNFGRAGFLLAVLYDRASSRWSVLCGHLCILFFAVMAVVPCRLFTLQGLGVNGGKTPIMWQIASFLSPLSAGQELMFYSIYATQANLLCPEWPDTNDTVVTVDVECVPYAAMAGLGNYSSSFVLMPIVYRVASVSLWTMTLFWVFGTLVWANRRYDPFLKAFPDSHEWAMAHQSSNTNPTV